MLANVVLACALYLFSERGPGSAYDTRGAAGLGNITNIAKELLGDSLTEVGKCLVHVQDGRAVLGQSRALAGLQSRLHSRDIRKELLVVQLPM